MFLDAGGMARGHFTGDAARHSPRRVRQVQANAGQASPSPPATCRSAVGRARQQAVKTACVLVLVFVLVEQLQLLQPSNSLSVQHHP